MQVAPAAPHAAALVEVTHVAPEQQPAHVAALQPAHTPPAHASEPGHVVHAEPPAPHALGAVPGKHVVPLQQPPHDVPSHTHAPPTQCWPAPHASPLPQRHAPPLQVSARTGSHAAHDAPAVPHALVVGTALQLVPAQQPVGHEVASHTQRPPAQR